MRRICAWVVAVLLSTGMLWGVGPNEEYVRIYAQMQEAESLESSGRRTEALAAYLTARNDLLRLKSASPSFSPDVVDFRLRYLNARIEELAPSAAVTPAPQESQPPATTAAGASSELQQELARLRGELQSALSENASLQAKLQEALAVRPAEVDPAELARAEERNRQLLKELELLRVALTEARATSGEPGESKEVQRLRESLRAREESLAQQEKHANDLAAQRATLERRVAELTATAGAAEALRAENALLKQQLAHSQAAGSDAQLSQAQSELALLRSETEILRLEKAALEDRLRRAPTDTAAAELANAQARIAALERERDTLKSQLNTANQGVAASSIVAVGEPTGTATEVAQLKARLAAYEAKATPYSIEELALFRLSLTSSGSRPASKSQPPPGAGKLFAQAETHFRQGEYRQAETVFQEVLREHNSDAFTMANLASVQIEQGKEAEAEANLLKALEIAPNDPFTLTMLGLLEFRREHYDAALDRLSLAAQLNPDNPTILNYLGVVLSQKGLRGPAESVFRRAIQLQPDFTQAHYNLALAYAMQEPPALEVARWHYQKALAGGHLRSIEMERLLDR